jgi:hypothetical protein
LEDKEQLLTRGNKELSDPQDLQSHVVPLYQEGGKTLAGSEVAVPFFHPMSITRFECQ